ncbi:C-type lectin lectoxin-Lio2-like [Aplysia californica]|uniref:C-type lectin lectoxin-Lio2-like n=1 Tax=Aplysia californica TaxID=6500 RepID=A0ABM0JSB8_APLCA|nr:C-type lectin lectoxin-Lio2-like [Aplysia californica]
MGVRGDVPPQPQDGQSIHKYKKLYILTWICFIVTSLLVSSAAIVDIVQTVSSINQDQMSINIRGELSAVQEKFDNLEKKVSEVEDDATTPSKLKLCSHGSGCEQLTSRPEAMTHCYKVSDEKTTWADARKKCESLGGFLAEFHNHFTLEYVKRVVTSDTSRLWLGATDQGKEGIWTWVTSNRHLSVEDWDINQPNNLMYIEHCLEMDKRRRKSWNDIRCNSKLRYLCQRDGDNCQGWLEQE